MLPKMVFATLSEQSKSDILKKITPKYSKVYTHHVTLVYAPKPNDMNRLEEFVTHGQKVLIMLGRNFSANGVEASEARVYTLGGREVPIKNAKPHVTISTDNKPPVLSNDMLEGKGEFRDAFETVETIHGSYEGIVEYIN